MLILGHPTQNLESLRLSSFFSTACWLPRASSTRGRQGSVSPPALGVQSTPTPPALALHSPSAWTGQEASLLGPGSLFSTLELDWSVTVQMWPLPFSAWTPLVPPTAHKTSPEWAGKERLEAAFLLGAALVKAVILNSMRLGQRNLILIHLKIHPRWLYPVVRCSPLEEHWCEGREQGRSEGPNEAAWVSINPRGLSAGALFSNLHQRRLISSHPPPWSKGSGDMLQPGALKKTILNTESSFKYWIFRLSIMHLFIYKSKYLTSRAI